MPAPYDVPPFLSRLLAAKSPSGAEGQAQAEFDAYVEPRADTYRRDALGNRIAVLNPEGRPTLMLAGHLDELGFIVTYIDDQGFLYFRPLGNHDRSLVPGRRVQVLANGGIVRGITGKRPVHLMESKERDNVPQLHEMWIDIAAKDKADAQSRVRVGDVATYDTELEIIQGSIAAARAFDNKAGAYIVGETFSRLAADRAALQAKVVAVGTSQEEVGVRGATAAAYRVNPDFAIAVDAGFATDHPDCDKRKIGEFKLGGGPIITRGPNVNPLVYQKLIAAAESHNIPYQLEADPQPTSTDARAMQVARAGVASGLISFPLRYMHSPNEMVDLEDLERCIDLLVAFAQDLAPSDTGSW